MLSRLRAVPVVLSVFVALAMAFVAPPAAGDPPDLEAVRRAAENGDAGAELILGHAYMTGRGVPEDVVLAAKWLGRAADHGNPVAQYAFGTLFQWGKGVTKNEATAAAWYTRAAEQGMPGAQEALGEFYRDGKGVQKDDLTAVKWFRRAAENGDTAAQFNLGVMYRNARGVSPDPVEAHKWIMLAAARETNAEVEKSYRIARDKHAAELTPSQVAQAQERARDWMDAQLAGEPAPAPAPTQPVRVGGQIKQPAKLKNVAPVYPDIAKEARVQGVVIIECTIGVDGRVVDAKVLRGIPLLDQAAQAIVSSARLARAPRFTGKRQRPLFRVLSVELDELARKSDVNHAADAVGVLEVDQLLAGLLQRVRPQPAQEAGRGRRRRILGIVREDAPQVLVVVGRPVPSEVLSLFGVMLGERMPQLAQRLDFALVRNGWAPAGDLAHQLIDIREFFQCRPALVVAAPVDLGEAEIQVAQRTADGHVGQAEVVARTPGLLAEPPAHRLQRRRHVPR